MDTWAWHSLAACSGMHLDLFFGTEGARGPANEEREKEAKAVCAGCPVRIRCLEFALSRREHGVWGGLTEDERTHMRRTRLRHAADARRGQAAADEQQEEEMAS